MILSPKLLHDAFTIAQHLHINHGSTEVAMAALYHLVQHYLHHLGGVHSTDMTPLVDLMGSALSSYANANKLEVALFHSALAGLERAGESLRYIASYPDTVF